MRCAAGLRFLRRLGFPLPASPCAWATRPIHVGYRHRRRRRGHPQGYRRVHLPYRQASEHPVPGPSHGSSFKRDLRKQGALIDCCSVVVRPAMMSFGVHEEFPLRPLQHLKGLVHQKARAGERKAKRAPLFVKRALQDMKPSWPTNDTRGSADHLPRLAPTRSLPLGSSRQTRPIDPISPPSFLPCRNLRGSSLSLLIEMHPPGEKEPVHRVYRLTD